MGEETLRHDEVETIPGACHCDTEQTSLLLDLVGRADAEI